MKNKLPELLQKHSASIFEISAYKFRLKNNFSEIDFLKERYDDGYVVVVKTPIGNINLYNLINKSKDASSGGLFQGNLNNLDELMEFTIAECSDILQGDYSRLQP